MMTLNDKISRRSFLVLASAIALASVGQKTKRVPVGLELYSVRDQLKPDLTGTLRAVAKMGYEGVEFFSPYFDWTPDYAKEVKKHRRKAKSLFGHGLDHLRRILCNLTSFAQQAAFRRVILLLSCT